MSTLNIPSYNALLSRDRQIKSIQDLYENLSKVDPSEVEELERDVKNIKDEIPAEASEDNQLADKRWVTEKVSEKEDAVAIEAVSSVISSLSAEVNKYYRIDVPAETLAIALPTISDATSVKSIVFYMTGGTTPAITFTSSHNVYYSNGFGIESGKTYEVNALYNGVAWVVASVEIVTSNP